MSVGKKCLANKNTGYEAKQCHSLKKKKELHAGVYSERKTGRVKKKEREKGREEAVHWNKNLSVVTWKRNQ